MRYFPLAFFLACAGPSAVERFCDPRMDLPRGTATEDEAAARQPQPVERVAVPEVDRWRVRSVGEPVDEPRPSRPRRVGGRDIHLHGAPFAEAARFIAHAGRFNVIVGEDLTMPVTVDLRGVEPYDALLALARAHGAAVEVDGAIVMIRRASAGGRSSLR